MGKEKITQCFFFKFCLAVMSEAFSTRAGLQVQQQLLYISSRQFGVKSPSSAG